MKSMSYVVPAYTTERKHKTTAVCILKQTAIYGTEQLGGLVGLYTGGLPVVFIWSCIAHMCGIIEEDYWTEVGYISAPILTATGTWCTGAALNQKGSFIGALIGAAIGTAA